VAAGADITFIAPAREGDVLVATAEERISYRRSGIYDVTVRRGDEVVAEFRGRSRAVG
jgi:acyl-coenzyme A thioesterase PaaI-like protein